MSHISSSSRNHETRISSRDHSLPPENQNILNVLQSSRNRSFVDKTMPYDLRQDPFLMNPTLEDPKTGSNSASVPPKVNNGRFTLEQTVNALLVGVHEDSELSDESS